ncbi:MAG: TonB-dependent receptor [Betaproteobacteria bacterium]|nr:TonB-dependent receptor [Betaproteobacteria bacterium]MDH5220504.1 TonB-dependent receptor [Betaproteobacteria bacterium]MDH5351368.1 TonB-dependent receptor [Betaproteobacteria bacterium]
MACLTAIPLAALAQQDDAVVVTATRVAQPSLEIPASIDRVYAEELREGRPQVNLSESLGRVPGLVVLNRQNYAQDLQISSRGFGARASFGVRGIRLISDNIPATMPDGQGQSATFDLGSAGRVEVLRGPFSAMYGNASGGVINVFTEEPPPEPTLELGAYAGSYDTWRAAAKFGIQRDNLGYLVDVSRFESNGYRDHSVVRRDQLNTKISLGLGAHTALTVVGMALHQPDTQDPLGLSAAQVAQNPQQADPVATLFNTRKSVDHDQVGMTLDHRIDRATRLEALAWGGTRDVEQYLAFVGALPLSSGGVVDLDRKFGGAALRLFRDASLGGRALRLAAGLEYERMDERRRGYENNFGVAGALKRDEDNVVYGSGVFAQGEWLFAERWSAHAGLRASRVAFESTDYYSVGVNPDDSGSKDYSDTTPVAGIVFRLDPQTSLYANYGKGFETPTFAELAYRNSGTGLNFDLEASSSRHVEAGFKAVRPGLGRLNLAVFDVRTEDEIVTDQSSGGRTTYRNAGGTSRRGMEVLADSLWRGPFEARAAFTWLAATFDEDFGTPSAGKRLPGVPEQQFYAEGAWRHAPWGLRLGLEVLYRSKVPVNDVNSEFAPSFTVVNAVAGFEQRGARWRLTEFLRVDNIGDEAYVGSVIVNDGNGRFYEPAPQRNILVGVQANLQF